MQITYLGTGAAEGVPALFCNCAYCRGVKARRGREIRSRAQVLLDGELSIDFPPDAFLHAAYFGVDLSAVKYLLVTHSHMDHFSAHELILRGYKYAHGMTSKDLRIYANEEIGEVFAESTRREMKPVVAEGIHMHTVGAFEELSFGDWRVYTLPARHTSREPLVFLLEKGGKRVLHLSDTGALSGECYSFLKEIGGAPYDLITFDCTFLFGETAEGARHMGLDENARTFEKLASLGLADGHTLRVLTHFSHNSAPSLEAISRAEREFGAIGAYDGLTLEI